MENVAYKNHNEEINELINILLENKIQVVLYNSHEGYGNTAFIQRIMFLLHATKKFQLLHAELSPSEQNPLHEVTKNIICKKGNLYHRLQLFSNEHNSSQDIPIIFTSLIKDLTQSETIAALLTPPESIPIYSGFYQDRLKQNFFDLLRIITKQQRLLFFVDNVHYMDNDSIYELQALLQNPNVTLVLFKSGDGKFFEKFHDEISYKFSEVDLNFPEPDVSYVQKLASLYNKSLSEYEATALLLESKKNIRKILCNIRKPNTLKTNPMLEDQILKIITLYDDYISNKELFKIYKYTPYSGLISEAEIDNYIKSMVNMGLLKTITVLETRETLYKTVSNFNISMDIADHVIISRALSDYYNNCENLDYKHLCHSWTINASLNLASRQNKITKKILLVALQMGYKISEEIIQYSKQRDELDIKILSATFLFCNANYVQAKNLLENILAEDSHRSLQVMYAISLNRCRNHKLAEVKLQNLIDSSNNIDETTILVSFLISNHVHSRKLNNAKKLYKKYSEKLKSSKKYPYFLRNSATIFDASVAYALRSEALEYFKKLSDFFGYYSTIINMTNYLIRHESIEYTISIIQNAFNNLQQYNASQIHLAANNLGICYLYAQDYFNALKYLSLCFEKAQSIMPKGYAAINLSFIFLQKNQLDKACQYLEVVSEDIRISKLARLKAHFYLQCAFIEYVNENLPNANTAIINTLKYCSSTESANLYATVNLIKNNIANNIPYNKEMFSSLFKPCFLEYWTINSVDALSNDFLPR